MALSLLNLGLRREISPPLSLTGPPVRPGVFFPVFHGGFGFFGVWVSRGLRPSCEVLGIEAGFHQ